MRTSQQTRKSVYETEGGNLTAMGMAREAEQGHGGQLIEEGRAMGQDDRGGAAGVLRRGEAGPGNTLL